MAAAAQTDRSSPGYNRGKAAARWRTLREVRAERGIGLRELETLSGVNRATISQIERGTLLAPADTLRRIAQVLNIQLEQRFVALVISEE